MFEHSNPDGLGTSLPSKFFFFFPTDLVYICIYIYPWLAIPCVAIDREREGIQLTENKSLRQRQNQTEKGKNSSCCLRSLKTFLFDRYGVYMCVCMMFNCSLLLFVRLAYFIDNNWTKQKPPEKLKEKEQKLLLFFFFFFLWCAFRGCWQNFQTRMRKGLYLSPQLYYWVDKKRRQNNLFWASNERSWQSFWV